MKNCQPAAEICVKNLSDDDLVSALHETQSSGETRREILLEEYKNRISKSVFSLPKNRNEPIS